LSQREVGIKGYLKFIQTKTESQHQILCHPVLPEWS